MYSFFCPQTDKSSIQPDFSCILVSKASFWVVSGVIWLSLWLLFHPLEQARKFGSVSHHVSISVHSSILPSQANEPSLFVRIEATIMFLCVKRSLMFLFGPDSMLTFLQQKSPFQYCSSSNWFPCVHLSLPISKTNFAGPHPRLTVLVRPRKMMRRRIKQKQSRGMAEIAEWRRFAGGGEHGLGLRTFMRRVLGSNAAKRKHLE